MEDGSSGRDSVRVTAVKIEKNIEIEKKKLKRVNVRPFG